MKNRTIYIVLVFVIAIVIWVAYTFYMAYEPKKIILQGEVDAQSYNISSKLSGRISEVFVSKGDGVEVGDTIFSISSPEVQAKLAQAKAAQDAASAQKTQANNGARKEKIQVAHDEWKKQKLLRS
ncbi:MAG: biotin/lipoyl-binding protein [Sulfurimonas sp.]|nr:biotin/lipoyl-binding protein [Sulfurimonas sp.]